MYFLTLSAKYQITILLLYKHIFGQISVKNGEKRKQL